MAEYLDFKDIAARVPFKALLDHLNIPYTEKKKELKGEIQDKKFIVNIEKNLFFSPGDTSFKGSIINFLAYIHLVPLREAALEIKKQFLTESKQNKRQIPELTLGYTQKVEKLGITQESAENFEIGTPEGKTIMAGKVAFKCYDADNNHIGYVGLKEDKWFYPKGFEASKHLYNYNRRNGNQFCILTTSPLKVIKFFQQSKPQAVGMFNQSLSDTQIDMLKQFKYILVDHPAPENIVLRLSKHSYVKVWKDEG